ncbi:hypothetical protein HNP84_000333 [Thermocatellispora tengchongensis]|uniref:Uncharacterized protein n=1 Tax=Thermocatellispora tengchongensis TaxID=1073253 RepID=A0A840P3M3_9ACTN|nr:DUF6343 family protein [Thermocatellispora tengchongensis]MBB5130645.1 hypothetical protein [Thermocatellispora tengchongensis]
MWGNRHGTEPRNARSPLRTRAALSGVVLPIALIATVFFVWQAVTSGAPVWWAEAAIAGVVTVIAAVDLLVLRNRMHHD